MSIDERVRQLTALSYRRCWWFVGVAVVLAGVAFGLAMHLELRSSFVELLPSRLPSVQNLKQLLGSVGGDGTVLVSVEALDGASDLPKAEAWAARLGQEFRDIGPGHVRSVLYNVTETEALYADHWPLFVPLTELRHTQQSLTEEVHRRKLAANPFVFDSGDEAKPAAVPLPPEVAPWLNGDKLLPREQVLADFQRYDHGYLVHPDHRSVTILVRPTGTSLSVSDAKALLERMQAVVDRHRAEMAQDRIRAGFAGSFPLLVASYQAIIRGIASTAVLVLVLEMLVLLVFFREVRPVVVLMAAILVAVLVDFGLTRLVIGYLNTQTAFLGAIVVGNGINYGLVYLARVRQQRASGASLPEALADGAVTSARATFLAALASTVSFGVLAIASNRGFRHFAFIGGLGMFLCWVATFLLVPAFFGVTEKVWPLRTHLVRSRERVLPEQRSLHPWLAWVFTHPKWIAGVSLGLVLGSVMLFVRALPTAMETNVEHLDNRLTSADAKGMLRDNERANAALGQSAEGAVALLPSAEAADAYCDVVRQRQTLPVYAPLIDRCETLSGVVPGHQPERLDAVGQIGALLSDALLDQLPAEQRARAEEVRGQLRAQRPIAVDEAPQPLVDRFREADGTLGNVAIVTAKTDARLEEGPRLISFAQAVRDVPVEGHNYDAAGEQVVIADLWADIFREGPRTTLLSFLGVCALVVLLLRGWRRRLEVLVTLLSGVVLMAGVGTLFGFKINFFNFIVFPVTFGIAVDYGANVSARIHTRHGAVLAALAEVGPSVFVCSLTSIVGYFSILFSVNQALQSFGRYAMVGEVTSIATALILLPALALLRAGRATAKVSRRKVRLRSLQLR